jgi:hypothetical protein
MQSFPVDEQPHEHILHGFDRLFLVSQEPAAAAQNHGRVALVYLFDVYSLFSGIHHAVFSRSLSFS